MKYLNELETLKNENLKYTEMNGKEETYIGQINLNNEKEGKGILIYNETKECFIGYWKGNKKDSKGKKYDKDFNIILEGNFEEGLLNGKGMKILDNGTKYEGNFKNDKMNGSGIYYFTNGTKWEGNSVDDKKEGIGKLTDSEGNIKDVEYKDDVLVVDNNINENNNNENNNNVEENNNIEDNNVENINNDNNEEYKQEEEGAN